MVSLPVLRFLLMRCILFHFCSYCCLQKPLTEPAFPLASVCCVLAHSPLSLQSDPPCCPPPPSPLSFRCLILWPDFSSHSCIVAALVKFSMWAPASSLPSFFFFPLTLANPPSFNHFLSQSLPPTLPLPLHPRLPSIMSVTAIHPSACLTGF